MNTKLIPLPTEDARLPQVYESAKHALTRCEEIDECKEWADKAEALASYAKQAGDESLRKTADRIQARAIRRCGELLAEIKPASGKRTDCEPREVDHPRSPTRKEAARDAGLSSHQQKTALRVANVPEEEFEEAVESPEPPTVTALAERGKQRLASSLLDMSSEAKKLNQLLSSIEKSATNATALARAARTTMTADQLAPALRQLRSIITELRKTEKTLT